MPCPTPLELMKRLGDGMSKDGIKNPGKLNIEAKIVITMNVTMVDLDGLKLASTPKNPDNP